MNVPIEWDGKTRIGPLVIGMTDSQMKAELPGQVIVDPSPLVNPDDGYTWESGEYGLAVAVVDGIVVSAYTNGKGHGLLDKARAMGLVGRYFS